MARSALLQHRPVRFLHALKKHGIYSARPFTRPHRTNPGFESNTIKPQGSGARLRRLCFGKTFRPVKRTYSAKITCLGVPSQQPFASSHIKPLYYIRIFIKLQHFFCVQIIDFYAILRKNYVHIEHFFKILFTNTLPRVSFLQKFKNFLGVLALQKKTSQNFEKSFFQRHGSDNRFHKS